MTELRTRPSLLKSLERAAKMEPTAAELRQQRLSFVMGSLKDSNSITRERVSEVLAAHEGKRKTA